MTTVLIVLSLRGQELHLSCPVDDRELSAITAGHSGEAEYRLVEKALEVEAKTNGRRVSIDAVEGWELKLITTNYDRHLKIHGGEHAGEQADAAAPGRIRTVGRCRSLLEVGNLLLPRDVRDEALDEWMDELECAAAEDLPIFRRALSILLRSLPALAWRSRRPAPARRGRAD